MTTKHDAHLALAACAVILLALALTIQHYGLVP